MRERGFKDFLASDSADDSIRIEDSPSVRESALASAPEVKRRFLCANRALAPYPRQWLDKARMTLTICSLSW
jgi:hypothetical protein